MAREKQDPAVKEARERLKGVEHVQPIEPSAVDFEGASVALNPTQVYAGDHPVVTEFPHLFKPLVPERQRPAVEATTAEPGAKRTR